MATPGRKGGSGVVHLNGVARSKGKEKKGAHGGFSVEQRENMGGQEGGG
jgi:hypothetical protein